jgi:2-hydroxychromene-2-carboxylate isomerase
MLLGGIFKATGNHSPIDIPAKGRWMFVDIGRWARRYGATFVMNPHFPVNTLAAMRGAVGLQMRGKDLVPYLDAMFTAMWEKQRNLAQPEDLAATLREAGFDPNEFQAMISDQAVKDELKRVTDEAVARGVFGAPTFFVDGEMYWGQDRLLFVEEALAR